jgi:hypothetical protein
MNTGRKQLSSLAAFFLLLIVSAVPLGAQAGEEGAPRHRRIAEAAVSIRNLPDIDGVSIATPAKGSLVSIHGERAGWLEVEVPGGFAVWVFGRYLRPLGEKGVFEVTRNAVNIRPAPRSDVLSFPLPQRLHAGDHVRVIELLDPEAELETTWARIWSPPGVHAFVRATDTLPLGATEQGAEVWKEAMVALADHQPPPYLRPGEGAGEAEAVEVTPKVAVADEAETKARAEIEVIRRLLEEEAGKPTPDFGVVRSRLAAVSTTASSGVITAEVRRELERVGAFEAVAQMRSELEREREERAEAARRRQRAVWTASTAKDPLGHVFLSRGILLRQVGSDGTPRYFLRFGKEIASEVVCVSGRYDLDAFAGYEIGVQGESLQVTGGAVGAPPAIEVHRVEVIRRR